MTKLYFTSEELLVSDYLERYYNDNIIEMFEYIIKNNKKMQSSPYANSGCINYIIPSTLRKMFQVTFKEVDVPKQYVIEQQTEEV